MLKWFLRQNELHQVEHQIGKQKFVQNSRARSWFQRPWCMTSAFVQINTDKLFTAHLLPHWSPQLPEIARKSVLLPLEQPRRCMNSLYSITLPLTALFFFFPRPFFRVSLWPGLFYWSVSRLPGLLRSGLEGGWERCRGVLRRAPGWGWAGFPPRWCGLSNLGRASWPRRRAWRHGWAKRSIGRWGLLLGMFAKAVGLVVLWLGPVVWQTWMLLHSSGPPFQFRAPQVGSDGSRWVPGRSVPSSSSHPATRPL